jgi:glycerol uptake facilitator-like aquaporin
LFCLGHFVHCLGSPTKTTRLNARSPVIISFPTEHSPTPIGITLHSAINAGNVDGTDDSAQPTSSLRTRLLAEFLGTFTLLLVAFLVIAARGRNLSDVVSTEIGRFGTVAIALFVLMTVFDGTSSHFNPAVTIAHALAKRVSLRDGGAYIVVQTLASLLAAISASLLIGGRTRRILPNAARVSSGRAFLLELVATLCLVALYLSCERRLRSFRPMLVAVAMGAGALTIGRFTTVGMNPARSLGAALWAGFGSTTWIFLIAPLTAGLIVGVGVRSAARLTASLGIRVLAEFIGTFLSLFLGLAGLRTTGYVVGSFIFIIGPPTALFLCALITGTRTYFNPAISLALVVARRLPPIEAAALFIAQSVGAVAAFFALRTWLPTSLRGGMRIKPTARLTLSRLLILECIAAAIVMLVVLRRQHPILGPVGVASATLAMTLSIASFGLSNLNPAWAFATFTPRVDATEPRNLIWLVGGPFFGMLMVAALYRWLESPTRRVKGFTAEQGPNVSER